jgi:hypothetical protein
VLGEYGLGALLGAPVLVPVPDRWARRPHAGDRQGLRAAPPMINRP